MAFGFQVVGERFSVFVRHVFQRVVYLVNDAALVFSLGMGSGYGFPDSAQSVCAQNQDILYATVFQLLSTDSQCLALSFSPI